MNASTKVPHNKFSKCPSQCDITVPSYRLTKKKGSENKLSWQQKSIEKCGTSKVRKVCHTMTAGDIFLSRLQIVNIIFFCNKNLFDSPQF